MTQWTPEEIAYLREHYPNTNNSILARDLNRSEGAVTSKAKLLKVHKDFVNFMDVRKVKQRGVRAEPKPIITQLTTRTDLKPFSELKPKECQYGYGTDNVLFCAREVAKGKPYCEKHCKVCYGGKR